MHERLAKPGSGWRRDEPRPEDPIYTWARPVLGPNGRRYACIADAAAVALISQTAMRGRLRKPGSGWRYAEPRPEDPVVGSVRAVTGGRRDCCPVLGPDGRRYACIADAAAVANVWPSTIRQWLAKPGSGWRRDELRQGDRTNGKARALIAPDGQRYASITEAARAHGIARATLDYRLRHPGSGWAYADGWGYAARTSDRQ